MILRPADLADVTTQTCPTGSDRIIVGRSPTPHDPAPTACAPVCGSGLDRLVVDGQASCVMRAAAAPSAWAGILANTCTSFGCSGDAPGPACPPGTSPLQPDIQFGRRSTYYCKTQTARPPSPGPANFSGRPTPEPPAATSAPFVLGGLAVVSAALLVILLRRDR